MTECRHVPEQWRRPGREWLCAMCRMWDIVGRVSVVDLPAPSIRGAIFRVSVAAGVPWPGTG